MSDLIGILEKIKKSGNLAGDLDSGGLSRYETDVIHLLNQIIKSTSAAAEYDLMKYKLVDDALGIALWDMDVMSEDPLNPVHKITWSKEFRQILGFADENDFPDLLGSWIDRLHPEDKDKTLAAFTAHTADRTGMTPYDVKYRIMMKNGEYRYLRAFGATLRDSAGVPVRTAGAVMDIHEQMTKEAHNESP